jgi:hypothetical protein
MDLFGDFRHRINCFILNVLQGNNGSLIFFLNPQFIMQFGTFDP